MHRKSLEKVRGLIHKGKFLMNAQRRISCDVMLNDYMPQKNRISECRVSPIDFYNKSTYHRMTISSQCSCRYVRRKRTRQAQM